MQKLTILNSREVKKMKKLVMAAFNYFPEEDYAYLQNEKDKIFLINKDISRIELNNLRIDKMGLYFAELKKERIRLSKEGAQLLFLEAKKNKKVLQSVVKLSKEEVKEYFTGLDLEKDLGAENKLVLLEYAGNCLGCATYKEGKILNFLPKIHGGEVIL